MKVLNCLQAFWGYCMFLVASILIIIFLFFTKLFDPKGRVKGWVSYFWGNWIRITTGLKFEFINLKNLDLIPEDENGVKKCITVSNHRGFLDHVIIACLKMRLSTIAKKMLYYIPPINILMYLANVKCVDRGTSKARKSIDKAIKVIKKTFISYHIYPEGTRSRTGKLGKFKKGAFILAIETGLPVVPLSIINSAKALPPGKFFAFNNSITVKLVVGEPISTKGLSYNDRDYLLPALNSQVQYI